MAARKKTKSFPITDVYIYLPLEASLLWHRNKGHREELLSMYAKNAKKFWLMYYIFDADERPLAVIPPSGKMILHRHKEPPVGTSRARGSRGI